MTALLTKTAEFTLKDQSPTKHPRKWLNYDPAGQAFMAKVHAQNHQEKLPIGQRDYQIRCRCNDESPVPMTIRRDPEKKGSAARYTLITVHGYANLHDDRCENHMANSQDDPKARQAPPDKTPVRPAIYGKDRSVALDTRGCTSFASGGERVPSDHEGKGAGKRTSTDPLPAKWGKLILNAAHYNVTRRGLPGKPHPSVAGLFMEIAVKSSLWTFGQRELLKERMYIPYLKNAVREDCTPRMMAQLGHIQDGGPGFEGLFVLGVFGQTHGGEGGSLEVRFPVIGVRDSKEWPFVLLPMERELFTAAQGAALKRDNKGLWHYAAAVLGWKECKPTITDLALLPYLSTSGCVLSSFRDRVLAELLHANRIPFERPLHYHRAIRNAWGTKPPDFILLDHQGMERAFIVVFGDGYLYDEEGYRQWDAFYRERAAEWGLDYLPWLAFQDHSLPDTIATYRTDTL